jgi:cyanophycin synthetase
MIDLTRHPRLLKFLSYFVRAKNFLLRRKKHDGRVDRNLSAFYERVWREAAAHLGATIESLGYDHFEIRHAGKRIRVQQNYTGIDDLVSYRFARTKPVVYSLLERHGLPVPRHMEFSLSEMPKAADFMEQGQRDCVVKPAAMTGGGLAVTTGIRTRTQLAWAGWAAFAHSDKALIEEQVEGDNYRLLYLDGKLIDAVVRRPPGVIGDGTSSVQRLVEAANAARLSEGAVQSHGTLTLDLDMRRTLEKQGLSLRSVPERGQRVVVKTVINENRGEDNETATALLGESVIADGARAATLVGLRLAGVDVITRDPAAPLRESGGVILEVNSPPGYYWHYHKRDGAFPLAVHVLEALLETAPSPQASLRACGVETITPQSTTGARPHEATVHI